VIALFVALGGTSAAVVQLTRGSVRGKHIHADAVTGSKVKNASLLGVDFAPGQLPRGEKGEKGDPGTDGQPGAAGSPAASVVMGNVDTALPAGSSGSLLAPSGTTAPSGNEVNRAQQSPNATIVVRDLAVTQGTASGATGTRFWRLKDLTNPPFPHILLQCSIAGATAKTCNSGSQTATVPAGSKLVIEIGASDTTPVTFASWAWRATTP
jgi:hypothetical protein